MSEAKSARKAVIDISKIEILKTSDGRFFAPDSSGGLSEIAAKGRAESVLDLLSGAESLNSPGGKNFEAAKKLLEQYRILSLSLSGGEEEDRFDAPANAEKSKTLEDPIISENSAASYLARMDRCLDILLSSSGEEFLDAGELLYARYIKPEYGSKQTEFFMALFKCSRATYFRLLSHAIGLLSAMMFGVQ